MNDIDEMPSECHGCPYWEIAKSPYYCYDCVMNANGQELSEELIHCKDCKYCSVYANGYNSYCNAGHNISYVDGFCSEAEPKAK